jgi:glycerol-3-phosphate acyltransferase PlsY
MLDVGRCIIIPILAMAPPTALILLIPLAYLIGSIPFGLLVGWAKGIDVRKAGSGNIGATNVGRLLGRQFFLLVFTLDAVKGLAVMLIASIWTRGSASYGGEAATLDLLWLAVGFAVIAGHMFSVFLRFRGGKGVATSAGVLLGVWPYFTLPAIVALAVCFTTLKLTRYMSVASITAAATFPVAFVLIGLARHWDPLGRRLPLLIFSVIVAAMIIYKHRGNLARLRAGTEGRL